MQDPDLFLTDYLTATPSGIPGCTSGNTPMSYVLNPIAQELAGRVVPIIRPAEDWIWFDFFSVPEGLAEFDLVQESFFETSLGNDAAEVLDGIVINLQLGWCDFEKVFALCRQWLKPGGHLLFSSLGPDTLFELREAWQAIDQFPHVHDFPDLHQLGDQLSRSGFENPILDAEWQGIEFEDIDLLLSDLRGQGFVNYHRDRRRTLTGKNRVAELRKHFALSNPVQMTVEIIFGYAKAPEKKAKGIHVRPPSI